MKHMKKIYGFLLGVALLLPQTALGLAQPVSPITYSGTTSGCQSCLRVGMNLVSVLKFRLNNTTASSSDVSQITFRYSGTATSLDLGQVRFYDDINGVFLGSTTFDFSTKIAVLTGAPIMSVPANSTGEITAYVNVKPTAVVGRNAKFFINTGDVLGDGGLEITGNLPHSSPLLSICAGQTFVDPALVQVLSANGGEVWTKGEQYTLSWVYKNAPSNAWVKNVELLKGGVFVRNLDVETTPRILPGGKLCPGQVVRWTIPQDLVTGSNYKIRVRLYKGATDSPNLLDTDVSDANFRIE